MSEESPTIKSIGPVGTYQVCLKSGATVVLDGVELCAFVPMPSPPSPTKPWSYFFQRSGVRVSFTPHFVTANEFGEKPLDDFIDAIFRLK